MQLQKWLRWGIIAGLFLIPFVSFIVSDVFFFPFITGKGFAFRIIVEVVFALWVILALYDPQVRPRKSAVAYIFGALIVLLAIADLIGMNPSKSFWSNFERMEGWILFIHLGMYLTVVSSFFTEKLWRAFFNTWIGVSVAMGAFGVLQLAGVFAINQGGVRVDGTFGNATYLAIFMLFNFFLTLIALAMWKPSRWMQIGYSIALVFQTLMIFYAATRGTILGLVGGLFVAGMIFVVFGKDHTRLRKAGAGLAIAIVLAAGGFYLIRNTAFVRTNDVLERIASINLHEGATRFTIWKMALKGIEERPITGWGQESFNYVFNQYYQASMYGQEPWFDRAHDQFLDMAIAGGLGALLLYLTLFGAALWYLWRGNTFDLAERALFTGLLVGYAFHNLFVFDNLISYALFMSVLGYLAMRRGGSRVAGGMIVSPPIAQMTSGVVIVLLVAGLWYVNVPGMARASTMIEAIKPHGNDLTQNFNYFKKAVTGSGLGRQEANEQLMQFTLQILSPQLSSASTPEFKQEVVTYTKDAFATELTKEPNDVRELLFYGSFLRQLGDYANASSVLTKALSLSPQKQALMFELGILATNQKDMPGALKWFKQAYDEAPGYEQALVYYAVTAIEAGQTAVGEKLLIDHFGTATPNNDFVLQAYLDTHDFASVIKIAEGRAAAKPNDAQTQVQLAAAYLSAGRRTDAVAALQKAEALNPDFKQQGDYYIQQIEAGKNP